MDTLESILGERRTYSDVAYNHTHHSFAQLILPLRGTLFLETSFHQFELSDSHLFFLLPNIQHTFYAKNNNEFLVLDIPNFMLSHQQKNKMDGSLIVALDKQWEALRFLMLSEVSHASRINQDLTTLFNYAYRLLQKEYTPCSIQYIHANLHESLHLQKLAELEGYNLTYYCEWFKKLTGVTPTAYIQTIRLEKAKELLAKTNLSVLQIAQQIGYDYHSSLTRLFKQHEKMTPLTYRQKNRR
jgi:AraC-like DNA-binding protein